MIPGKNKLEATAATRFLVFALVVFAAFVVLEFFKPNPKMSAYVDQSEYLKPYTRSNIRRSIEPEVPEATRQKIVAVPVGRMQNVKTKTSQSMTNKQITGKKSSLGTNSEDVLQQAIAHIDSGEFEIAREMIEKALEGDPNNENLLMELGMIFLIDYRQPENALPHLEKALKVNPGNKVVLNELVGVYQEIGQNDAGLEFMKNLLNSNPESPDLNLGVGQLLMSENNNYDAAKYLETAIKNGDQPDYVYSDLAEIYAKTGNSDRAIEVYRASVERARSAVVENSDPNFKELNEDVLDRAIINLAKELSKNGKFKEAEDQVLSILKRRPQHPEAQYQLGKILKGKG